MHEQWGNIMIKESRWKFRSQEHSNKVNELFGWACKSFLSNNELPHIEEVMNVMRDHPEYDEVFNGLVVHPNGNGFTMFKVEDKQIIGMDCLLD